MSCPSRLNLLAAIGFLLLPQATLAQGLGLERAIWADPALASLRLRVTSLPDGRLVVTAKAGSEQQAEAARRLLEGKLGVERFQVEVDPRLLRGPVGPPAEPPLEIAARAIRTDAGTRLHAGLLGSAGLDSRGVLSLPRPDELGAGTERRLVRLLLAQPGIEAVSFRRAPHPSSPVNEPASSEASGAESATPTRTRLELDPIQPEAVAIESQEPRPRTRIHVDLPPPEPLTPPVGPDPGDSPLDAMAETGAVETVAPAAEPAETDSAPSEAAADETEPEPVVAESLLRSGALEKALSEKAPAEVPAASPADARIDRVIEDLLAEAMALEGAPKTLKARVGSGVVIFGGQVESRELALRLRELARNFDGVRRVTGGLMVTDTAERIPMDAVPD